MSHLVNYPLPLTRLNPWYPGQIGVLGTWNKTGLRQTGEGAIYYVDPNAAGVSDARDGTDPTDPLQTVQAAIDKCLPYRGDTIVVMANNNYEYTSASYGVRVPLSETVTIDVPGVQLIGVCKSAALGVPWYPTANNDVLITITAPDVLVEGFNFDVAAFTGVTAIYSDWNGVTTFGDAPVIRNCYFADGVVYGIVLNFVYNAKIYQNEFRCEANGACIFSDVAWSAPAVCDIYDNRFWTTDAAIDMIELDDSNIYLNSFYNSLAATPAAATNLGINIGSGDENHVFNNWFSCLLPVPAAGDINDFCTAGTRDAWVGNMCMNGLLVTNPT
jgi:hypothetical protein